MSQSPATLACGGGLFPTCLDQQPAGRRRWREARTPLLSVLFWGTDRSAGGSQPTRGGSRSVTVQSDEKFRSARGPQSVVGVGQGSPRGGGSRQWSRPVIGDECVPSSRRGLPYPSLAEPLQTLQTHKFLITVFTALTLSAAILLFTPYCLGLPSAGPAPVSSRPPLPPGPEWRPHMTGGPHAAPPPSPMGILRGLPKLNEDV